MGQKANPNGMRLGITKDWDSRYFPTNGKDWGKWIYQDDQIRKYFKPYFKKWVLSSIEIERTKSSIRVIINSAKPGIVLGQEGSNIKKIQRDLERTIKDRKYKLTLDVKEVRHYDLDATIIANEIALQLENRVPFRIAQKKVIKRVMKNGAKGIKTQVSGRLNGVDMARTEGYLEGQVPLQTLRNDIDYAVALAKTTYGILGVKVWISRGEKLANKQRELTIEREKKIARRNDKRVNNNVNA